MKTVTHISHIIVDHRCVACNCSCEIHADCVERYEYGEETTVVCPTCKTALYLTLEKDPYVGLMHYWTDEAPKYLLTAEEATTLGQMLSKLHIATERRRAVAEGVEWSEWRPMAGDHVAFEETILDTAFRHALDGAGLSEHQLWAEQRRIWKAMVKATSDTLKAEITTPTGE